MVQSVGREKINHGKSNDIHKAVIAYLELSDTKDEWSQMLRYVLPGSDYLVHVSDIK